MRSEVKHIFDRSACLSKRQVQAYLSGNMITEEVYAVEHHINGCPLCSIALDGLQMRKESLEGINSLSADFLKDHFGVVAPQLHLNSMTYARTAGRKKEVSFKGAILMFKLAVAAAACVGIMWYIQNKGAGSNKNEEPSAPQEQAVATIIPEPEENSVIVDAPIVVDSGQTTVSQPLAPATEPAATGTPITTTVPASTGTTTTPATILQNKEINTTTSTSVQQPVAIPPPVTKEEKPEPVKPEVIEKVQPKIETPAPEKPKPPVTRAKEPEDNDLPADGLQAANVLMARGKYTAAINKLRPEMRSDNKARRQEAVVMAAKAYLQTGNKARAIEMLNMIVDEGGPQKRTAKKMLKDLGASD